MPDITTESEAVAALEATGSFPCEPERYMEADRNLLPDLWLAWLVRKGVSIVAGGDGINPNWSATFRGLWSTRPDSSPLVAAARAFLENRNA
jgi:hypothetical protein